MLGLIEVKTITNSSQPSKHHVKVGILIHEWIGLDSEQTRLLSSMKEVKKNMYNFITLKFRDVAWRSAIEAELSVTADKIKRIDELKFEIELALKYYLCGK